MAAQCSETPAAQRLLKHIRLLQYQAKQQWLLNAPALKYRNTHFMLSTLSQCSKHSKQYIQLIENTQYIGSSKRNISQQHDIERQPTAKRAAR
jgi:hypothetical protein